MILTQEALKLDLDPTTTRLKRFIKDYVQKTKARGAVLNLSGGIDSSTATALTTLALGKDRVLALSLPEKETRNPADTKHTQMLAEKFGFKLQTIDISNVLEAYYGSIPAFDSSDKLSKGNIKARARMIFLYYYANRQNRIVVGSSDKSETMMGYFTKWGDIAADISPLMDLYKTQVKQLAAHIRVPSEIIKKPPSPQLWPGQLAEQELGIKYETLDLILLGLENFLTPEEIAEQLRLPVKTVEGVKTRWLSKEHKRRAPLTMKTEYRTIGTDFRLPYTLP
jgi:NAD+ synthase